MVSTYSLKTGFQKIWRPTVRALLGAGVTPNQVTIFTIVLSVLFAIVLSNNATNPAFFWTVPVFLFVRMALNAIDGMMAREGGQETPLGVFLNEIGDVLADVALFFAFVSSGVVRIEPMVVFSIFALLTEMAGVVAVQVGAPRSYQGPMGKSDRAVLMGVVAAIIALGYGSVAVFDVILGLGSVALLVTMINRVRNALGDANSKDRKGLV